MTEGPATEGAQPVAPVAGEHGPISGTMGETGALAQAGSHRRSRPGLRASPAAAQITTLWRAWRRPLGVAVALTVALRVVTELIALLSAYGISFPHRVAHDHGLLTAVWGGWDTGYYISIAQHGYAPLAGGSHFAQGNPASAIAFAPLYPWAMGLVHDITGLGWLASGQLTSALALVAGLAGLYSLVGRDTVLAVWGGGARTPAQDAKEQDQGRWAERRAGTAVALVVAFPTAFFLLAGYPESLAMACTVWAFVAARRRWWLVAGILAAAAMATKYYLVIVVAALLVEVWFPPSDAAARRAVGARWFGDRRDQLVRSAAVIVPALLALVAWMLVCDHLDGDPLAFLHAQAAWGRGLAAPWTLFAHTIGDLVHLRFLDTSVASVMELFDFVTVVALAVVAVVVFVRVRRSYGILLGLAWCVFTFQNVLISETREVLVLFPFFTGLALWADGHPWRERLLWVCFLPSAYFLIERFVTGRFAG